MKKRYKIYAILAALTLTTACEDNLDIKNTNDQQADIYWSSPEHAEQGVNAIYNILLTDGYYMRMTPALTDGRGDDFKADSPWLDLGQVANFTILPTSGPVEWCWAAYFQMVFRANQVIENVPNMEIDENLKNTSLGQAYFLRGLAYFNLKINFQRVPIILTVPESREDYYVSTASEEELWNQVVSDFQRAQELLPEAFTQQGRATKGAATGYLGKAYLYRQQWQAAADEFDKLINGSLANYSLMPEYKSNFGPFTENNAESLFEVQFASIDEVGGTIKNYGGEPNSNWMQVSSVGHTYSMDGYGYSDFLPTRWIYNEFKEERTVNDSLDPRLLATIASYEPEANSTTVYNGQPWNNPIDAIYPRKYTHDGFGFETESQGSTELSEINYRLLRYADILLMHAEALNELGRTSEAYSYIQQVRDRVNLPDLAVTKPNMTQEQMRDQIAHERALELSVEGIRIHDIVRWGWLYDSEKLAELKEHDAEFETWTPGDEYLPIPQRELDVNPNLEPNSAN